MVEWRAPHLVALLLLAAWTAAWANDTTARIGTGGLEFTQTSAVRMAEEILVISPKRISVRYRYVNESAHDVTTVVAFPMPMFGWNPGEAQYDAHVGPMSGFKTLVDGKETPTRTETRAWLGKRDITAALKSAGVDGDEAAYALLCSVSHADAGTCFSHSLPPGTPGVVNGRPDYQAQQVAWWEQRFPAGSATQVEHTYKPLTGLRYNMPQPGDRPLRGARLGHEDPEDGSAACTDDGADSAVVSRIGRLKEKGEVWQQLQDVEYVLGTGRNWKGPIGKFTLRIEKESPSQIVSLCFSGKPRRVSPTTLEFTHSDFVPQDSIVIYFYDVTLPAAPR